MLRGVQNAYCSRSVENISSCSYSEEAVERAARAAQRPEFIAAFREIAYTGTSPAATSLRKKQRILIAGPAGRRKYLLDDSDSAWTTATTAALRSASAEIWDTTSVIISERVSSICNADYILVLDDGRVEGAGTHSHLMETCPSYRRIAQVQMGGAPA
jgi:ATP-binding cassette subfamily B protein